MPTTIDIVGIDYSYTSPAITTYSGKPEFFGFSNCHIYSLTSNKKAIGSGIPNVHLTAYPAVYLNSQHRYNLISEWSISIIKKLQHPFVYLEGYSYGSSGRSFDIGENTGLLKSRLFDAGIPTITFAPTEIKKFATGKGNANKESMEKFFVDSTGFDIRSNLRQTASQMNPSSDIIDSFFIAKLGVHTWERSATERK